MRNHNSTRYADAHTTKSKRTHKKPPTAREHRDNQRSLNDYALSSLDTFMTDPSMGNVGRNDLPDFANDHVDYCNQRSYSDH